MATLLGWLGKTIKDTENNIGNFVNGAAQNVGNAVGSTARLLPDMLQNTAAQVTHNQPQVQKTQAKGLQDYNSSIPGAVLNGLGSSLNTFGKSLGTDYTYLNNQMNGTHQKMLNQALISKIKAQNLSNQLNNKVLSPAYRRQLQGQQQEAQNKADEAGKFLKGEVQNVNTNADPIKSAGAAANIITTLALPGAGKLSEALAKPIIAKASPYVGNLIAKGGGKLIGNTTEGALTGAALNTSNQLSQTGSQTTGKQLLQAAGQGFQTGAGFGFAGSALPLLSKGTKIAAPQVAKAIEASKPTNHPAVLELNDHLAALNQQRDALAARGLSEGHPAMIANAKAYAQTAQARTDLIKNISQAGFAKIPGREPSVPESQSSGKQSVAKASIEQPQRAPSTEVLPKDSSSLTSAESSVGVPRPTGTSQLRVEAQRTGMIPPEPLGSQPLTVPAPRTLEDPHTPALGQTEKLSSIPSSNITTSSDGSIVKTPNGSLVTTPAGKATRYADKTIPQSQFVGDQVSAQTKKNAPTYTPQTETGRLKTTLTEANKQGFDNFEENVHQRLQGSHIDSQTVSDAQAVAQRLEAKGDAGSLRKAADIYDKVSEHLTKAGQTVQAAAIMSRRTPDGIRYQVLRDLKKNNVKITDDILKSINDHIAEIKKTKVGTDSRKLALGKLAQEVDKQIPQGAISNLVSVWKAGLLSGVKTTQGNIISNATFGGLRTASTPITAWVDTAMSLITGKRSMTMTPRGTISGAIEGTKNGYTTLKTGVDLRTAADKYEEHHGISFKNKVLQKALGDPAQKMFDFMGAQDQPFYYSQLRKSLNDMARADGVNKELSGKALADHIQETLKNPPADIMQRAVDEANKSVLGYDTVAYKAIQGAKNGIEHMPVAEPIKRLGKAVVDVLAPFTRVPTAFLSRSIDFTPLGIGKEVLTQVANKKFDQRTLSRAIGEGLTGTGVIALGISLANSGQLSGDYPTDPKEQQRWKAQGIQPNSVKLGGTWVSLNYLGPIGMLFGAGKKYAEASQQGSDAIGSVSAAIAGFGQTLLGQSFLQGLNGFVDATKNPQQYAKSFLNSQAGSVVPAIVNDFANLTDGFQRQANNAWEAIINKIPGARETLNKKQDVYGNNLKQTPASTLLGVKPTDEVHNPVIDEVGRLAQVDPQNGDLQVTPTAIKNTLTIGNTQVKLTDQQKYDLQNKIGQATQDAWGKLIGTDQYKALSDANKAKALTNLRQDTTTLTQRQYVADNNLGTYTKKLTNAQSNLANGAGVASYTNPSTKGTTIAPNLDKQSADVLRKYSDTATRTKAFQTDNSAEFTYNQAKYNNDKASGKITPIQDIARKTALAKDQIGADYSQEVRQLYGQSKANIATYLQNNPNGDKLAQSLQAYDQALNSAGLTQYLKFKASPATSTTRATSRKSSTTRVAKAPTLKGTSAYKSAVTATQKIRVPKITNYKKSGTTVAKASYKSPTLKQYSVKLPKVPLRKTA